MIIRQTTTIAFEYPQDYLQEQEWRKTKDDRWVHKGTDTLGAVYENQISYSIGQPNNSEKPNNCEVKNYCDDCLYTDTCDSKEFFYACTSKATISKMEQVDKDINVRSNSSEKPNNCEYAENPSGDAWECGCFLDTYCEHQIYDRNPDGTINIVECGYEPQDEPQTERSE